jgi:hypothetical protein
MKKDLIKINEEISLYEKEEIPTEKETIAALLSLLESLSFEVCNPDIWFLAMLSAKEIAIEKYKIEEVAFLNVMDRFEKVRKETNKSNPIHSMF